MANTFKVLYRGTAAIIDTTLYTVPANTISMVTSVIVANTSTTPQTYTLSIDGIVLAPATLVQAGEAVLVEPKTLIEAGKTLSGYASAASVNFHISGLEVT